MRCHSPPSFSATTSHPSLPPSLPPFNSPTPTDPLTMAATLTAAARRSASSFSSSLLKRNASTLKVGVIGAGRIGRVHLETLASVPGTLLLVWSFFILLDCLLCWCQSLLFKRNGTIASSWNYMHASDSIPSPSLPPSLPPSLHLQACSPSSSPTWWSPS